MYLLYYVKTALFNVYTFNVQIKSVFAFVLRQQQRFKIYVFDRKICQARDVPHKEKNGYLIYLGPEFLNYLATNLLQARCSCPFLKFLCIHDAMSVARIPQWRQINTKHSLRIIFMSSKNRQLRNIDHIFVITVVLKLVKLNFLVPPVIKIFQNVKEFTKCAVVVNVIPGKVKEKFE